MKIVFVVRRYKKGLKVTGFCLKRKQIFLFNFLTVLSEVNYQFFEVYYIKISSLHCLLREQKTRFVAMQIVAFSVNCTAKFHVLHDNYTISIIIPPFTTNSVRKKCIPKPRLVLHSVLIRMAVPFMHQGVMKFDEIKDEKQFRGSLSNKYAATKKWEMQKSYKKAALCEVNNLRWIAVEYWCRVELWISQKFCFCDNFSNFGFYCRWFLCSRPSRFMDLEYHRLSVQFQFVQAGLRLLRSVRRL